MKPTLLMLVVALSLTTAILPVGITAAAAIVRNQLALAISRAFPRHRFDRRFH